MGVNSESSRPSVKKNYDFIYIGEIASSRRGFGRWITAFTEGALKDKTLLVVSKSYERIVVELSQYRNIQFIGPVPHNQVSELISSARFALNFIPDTEPFNCQTSTKMLEYAAAAVPVITTDYRWVRDFQKKHGGKFFYAAQDLSNFNWISITSFDYQFPDLRDFQWEKQIRNSGVLEFLQSRFTFLIT